MVVSADPPQVGRAPAVRLAADGNPLAGAPFYVNPTSAAMRAAQSADPPSPELTAIANTPQAYWIVPGSSASTVAKYTGDAAPPAPSRFWRSMGSPPRLWQLRRGWLRVGRRIPRMDRRHRIRRGRLAGGDCRRTRCARHGRLSVSRSAPRTLRPDSLRRRRADPESERGRIRRCRSPALAQPDDMAARLNQAGIGHARVSASTLRTSSPPRTKSVTARRFRASRTVRTT